MTSKTADVISLLRPHQYIKNVFIFLPAFFGGQAADPDMLLRAAIAFVAFCLAASGIEIMLDCM